MNGESARFLIDTHVLLWWLFDDPRLSGRVREIIRAPENTMLVSSASGREIAAKHRLGKLPVAEEAVRDLPSLLIRSNMEVLPITLEHALDAGALPGPHRDPFDRTLIAQARREGLPLVTSDPAFRPYELPLIW